MGAIESILFALLSFFALMIGIGALAGRKNIMEAVLGICTALFALVSAFNFRLALIDSGKNPAFLAFDRYPFVFPVYCVFIAAGVVLLIHGIVRHIKKPGAARESHDA